MTEAYYHNNPFLSAGFEPSQHKRDLEDEPKGDVEAIYNVDAFSFNVGMNVGLVGVSASKEQLPNLITFKREIEGCIENIISQRLKELFFQSDKEAKRRELFQQLFSDFRIKRVKRDDTLKSMIEDLKGCEHVVVLEALVGMLNEDFPPQVTSQVEAFFGGPEIDLNWKRYSHLLLVMYYCDANNKIKLLEYCNSLLNSEYFTAEDLLFISTHLFKLGEISKDFELARDAFVIISYANLIYPIQSDKIMVVIGEFLLNPSNNNSKTTDMLFMEFVSRRIATCNNGTPKLARTFCRLHLKNIQNKLREPISEKSSEFTEDLKCVLDKPYKAKYYDDDMERFLTNNDPKYLYLALNSVYFTEYDHTKSLLLNKASKLAHINQEVTNKMFRMDSAELSLLLYNCIHNYHVIYEKYFSDVEHALDFDTRPNSNATNCKGYVLAIKEFLHYYFHPCYNFQTRLIVDFKVKFYPHLFKVIKKNLQKIGGHTLPNSTKFCEEYRNGLAETQKTRKEFIENSSSEITKKWEKQADRYVNLRKQYTEENNYPSDSFLFSLLGMEEEFGKVEMVPCEEEDYYCY